MDINSNKYTYTFAIILVVVVAALLSFASIGLKPFQQKNIVLEKKQNILKSINIVVERDQADEAYDKYIKESLVIQNGKVVSDPKVPAFDIDMAEAIRSSTDERSVPLYVADKDGERYYIVPLRGKGLWGPIWGYIALKDDANTVAGATFDHQGETPGLGAEIAQQAFQDEFTGKRIMDDDGDFKSIRVVKKGQASDDFQVDGISGGTITSNGVDAMIEDNFKSYIGYFSSLK
ncbi:MAG: NADH:ubiquinone reductase (Na(+)-transporting) subunit C [Bacteroidota bacterium]|nr:NADH:ubiquinone reductase (Na(+)-transporting) subunit C [Bacteroidota bacterium]MDX5426462.1 NADH:ubiquinone reductase (Na(+)-transporting) subunit C [Bacteroidota bacterium]MDX5448908.1 NADH:ubiquinone reductase (Na(+)-transporting) subunit C [Bacteroidota bacterium]MDX5504498.1 NADH:ubiquinone reductase (Na(+)-transporting) subunit C [Bacteroidota bacterium]